MGGLLGCLFFFLVEYGLIISSTIGFCLYVWGCRSRLLHLEVAEDAESPMNRVPSVCGALATNKAREPKTQIHVGSSVEL